MEYKNWRIEDNNGIVTLFIDRHDAKVNSLNTESMEELNHVLDYIEENVLSSAKALLIKSAKNTGFIAGADITEFKSYKNLDTVDAVLQRGHRAFAKLEKFGKKIPVIAVIDGFCLGGGCELALACKYRIAVDDTKTKIGLPEVLLGIQPGWGGTVRLAKVVGGQNALSIMMQGRGLSAKAAKKLGVVNEAVPRRVLENTIKYYIEKDPGQRKLSFYENMTNKPVVKRVLSNFARSKTKKIVNPKHYPAPYAIIDTWENQVLGTQKAYDDEIKSFKDLLEHPTAQNLIRVFFLQENLKAQGKKSSKKINHVHVIGAGTMGGDIAAYCAYKGMKVTLQDRDYLSLAPAIKRADSLFKKKLKQPHLVERANDLLIPDVEGKGIKHADVIIEAVFEDLKVKQEIFKNAEKNAKPDAILATNTSSIPLDEINTVLKHPERLVGIHFFNPVPKMQLVEVVHGAKTSQDVIDNATAFVSQISKLPLPVKSEPGFLVNRVLLPYLMEAMQLLEEGVPAPALDKAMLDFGMPMGPIELADVVGLDVCLSVAENLSKHFDLTIPDKLRAMISNGNLGKKTGKGFYTYKKGKAVKPPVEKSYKAPEDITDRLVLRMLNELVTCLREEIVTNEDLADAGMIFGTGFAPFKGGPMNYVKTCEKEKLLEKFKSLETRYGHRFEHDSGWSKVV